MKHEQIHQTKNQAQDRIKACEGRKVLMIASVASMIDQFNMPNIRILREMGYEVHVVCNFKEGNTCDAQQIRHLYQNCLLYTSDAADERLPV